MVRRCLTPVRTGVPPCIPVAATSLHDSGWVREGRRLSPSSAYGTSLMYLPGQLPHYLNASCFSMLGNDILSCSSNLSAPSIAHTSKAVLNRCYSSQIAVCVGAIRCYSGATNETVSGWESMELVRRLRFHECYADDCKHVVTPPPPHVPKEKNIEPCGTGHELRGAVYRLGEMRGASYGVVAKASLVGGQDLYRLRLSITSSRRRYATLRRSRERDYGSFKGIAGHPSVAVAVGNLYDCERTP